ncbi:MAG: alcohol dehydrogenase catalytic domain-containing protein, partial [FCB group bacterium]|nr:alcohol dehydrogenase catalytic domain-containing protein [FCB group bacterium]
MSKADDDKKRTMKALVYDGDLHMREIPVPVVKKGESLIKVKLAGICATDREIASGYMNFKGVPGHEFVGVVKQSDDKNLIGKRVVGEINCGCGECEMCRSGLERHCPNRTTLGIFQRDGAFAEYLTLPDGNLIEILSEIDDRTAVFTEPLAAALEILEQVKIIPSWKVLIIGDGKLAALIAQVFRLHSVDLTILGKSAEKLTRFEEWGMKIIDRLTEPAGYDLVVEASGSPD